MDEGVKDAVVGAIVVIVIAISRILSHFEHKKTNKKVGDIYIKLNGELEQKIKTAIEEALKK